MSITRSVLIGVMCGGFLFAGVQQGSAQSPKAVPVAVPIVFPHAIDAAKAHIGDTVIAKTMQVVFLPGNVEIPKGTTIQGRIAETQPFSFDPTPYAIQKPSVLSIRFNKVLIKGATMEVVTSVRALASWSNSEDAMKPQFADEYDSVGTLYLIGGGSYRHYEKNVNSEDGDILGYSRKQGVFARLLQSEYTSRYSHFECEDSGDSEQSVAIFSPSACGLYGLEDVYIADDGAEKELGTFRLESRRHTIKLYRQSTALLQIMSAH